MHLIWNYISPQTKHTNKINFPYNPLVYYIMDSIMTLKLKTIIVGLKKNSHHEIYFEFFIMIIGLKKNDGNFSISYLAFSNRIFHCTQALFLLSTQYIHKYYLSFYAHYFEKFELSGNYFFCIYFDVIKKRYNS